MDRDPPARTEVVHESARVRVTRVVLPDRTVIRKEPLGPASDRRLEHELAVLERLRGVAGVAQLVDAPRYPGSIVLEDIGGPSLKGWPTPVSIDGLVPIALGLARAVAAMHHRRVIHCNIAPANIVMSRDGVPHLVDFALAMPFSEIRPEFAHQTRIVGMLEYLAPEQTGRTGRSVDHRADLYALGATLYELATGRPPFVGRGDPLRLTHDHLARVPVAPMKINPAVPEVLSAIILRLLEKEPDRRYQTADGMIADLQRLPDARSRPAPATTGIGEHDLPIPLLPPSRLVGRDDEVAALRAAFGDAVKGECAAVLVSGAPGVGMTALVDQLRSVVTESDGWFLAGKFDQYRRDLEFDAVYQSFRALGRLLLAEPDDQLAEIRERILAAVGPNASLLAAVLPEFSALLAVAPEPGDALTARVRLQQACVRVLRAVASPTRPVVMFLDDLQWAGGVPLGFVDSVLGEGVDHVLLVGAYRDADAGAPQPMATMVSRWLEQANVRGVRLANLRGPSFACMVAETLRVDAATAAGLVELIEPHTEGNPYATVELLNALRRDGLLTATTTGWQWDEARVRAHLGETDVDRLLAARLDVLPAQARAIVEAMACLGGRAELSVLEIATGQPPGVLKRLLLPALEERVLVVEAGVHDAVRFSHDRMRDAILGGLPPDGRRSLQLAMARRLAAVPELFAVAAEQYLPVVGALDDAAERRQAVELLQRAADQASLIGDHEVVNARLTPAIGLVDRRESGLLVELHAGRHAALYGLGRLDEGDEEYRSIEQLCTTVVQRADATCLQVRSLTHRNRLSEAIGLAFESLRELGVTLPAADALPIELDKQFGHLYRWLEATNAADEAASPEISDPAVLATGRLLNAALPAAYLTDPSIQAWLSLEALRVWLEHGPARTLLGPASNAAYHAMALRGDYAAGGRAMRRILALGEARGHEPETSQARFLFALSACWLAPIETGVAAARRAREGLMAGGDLANAGYAWHATVIPLLDLEPTLDGFAAEVDAGLAFVRRAGIEQIADVLAGYRRLADVLRGQRSIAAGDADLIDAFTGVPMEAFYAHLNAAIAAAVFDDAIGLTRHSAAAMQLLQAAPGGYGTALAHALHGLALAAQLRTTHGPERRGVLSALDDAMRWLAERAADAPDNFLHLLRLLEAERAWAEGQFREAVLAFDAARRTVAGRRRPWHRAVIAEHAGRFHLDNGVEQAGYELLAGARKEYLAWGATAKVEQLDWAYPTLGAQPEANVTSLPGRRGDMAAPDPTITTGAIDLLGILSASQALSSETSIEQLHARVVDVLSAMTGATGVHLVLWSSGREQWLLPVPAADDAPATLETVADPRTVPISVLRYAQRTAETVVAADATSDERFARDPYFARLACCSLLALPIVSAGRLRAVLVLENRLIRGAFSGKRLDAVKLIAGQLAVSLDNARVYADFRRIADEQAALRRVATLVARGEAPDALFGAVAQEVCALFNADGAAIVRFELDGEVSLMGGHGVDSAGGRTRQRLVPESITALVQTTGRAARRDLDDLETASQRLPGEVRSAVASPIVVEGRVWGSMSVGLRRDRLPNDAEQRLAGFTELVATAIANAQSRAELAASRARVVATGDETRRRIERDLHDGAQQRLVHTVITLKLAKRALGDTGGPAVELVDDALEHAERATEELRELAHGILPATLSRGLGAAIEALVSRMRLPVSVDVTADRLAPELEATGYFIVAEALTNTVKHARASRAQVTATVTDGVLRVEVRDDGVGGARTDDRSGLVGLYDRVAAMNGELRVDSPPGGGTTVAATIPLREP